MNDGDVRPDVRALLEQVGREMGKLAPLAPLVRSRLEGVSMVPRRSGRRYALIAVAAGSAAVAACAVWSALRPGGSPPRAMERRTPAPPQPLPAPVAVVTLGDTSVRQHLAMLVDSRTVLVLWSWRGVADGPGGRSEDSSPRQQGDYTEWRLHSGRDPDGTAWQWSLFIADPKVQAIAEPPAIQVRDPRLGTIRFAVTPRPCSWETVRRAMDSIVTGARDAPDLKDIRHIIAVHAERT
jgi:hypothetical protein